MNLSEIVNKLINKSSEMPPIRGLPYSDSYYTNATTKVINKDNCKNCGARFHPEECDYCGTPTSGASHRELLRAYASHLSEEYGNLVGLTNNQTLMSKTINERSLVYDQAVHYESARQIYAGKGLVQVTVPPKRTIASLFGFV